MGLDITRFLKGVLPFAAAGAMFLGGENIAGGLETISETSSENSNNKVKVETDSELGYIGVYDNLIEKYTEYFNSKLKPRTPLDSGLVKRIINVETGSPRFRNTAFKYDPMQIANKGDFALSVLASGKENTHLIDDFSYLKGKRQTPWKKTKKGGYWDYSQGNMDPESSIHGGIAWLFHKAAIYGKRETESGEIKRYIIKKGDTLAGIAKRNSTTANTIIKYNPEVDPTKLKIGQVINYKIARNEAYISGWKPWSEAVKGYNGRGDPDYVKKVIGN